MDQKKVGQFLKELRHGKGMTQEQLAAEFNVSSRTVSRWETGSNLPDISMLTEIADFYDVDVRELIEGERKSEMMNEETREVAEKMADYADNEKSRLLRTVQVISMLGVVASLLSIVLQTAGRDPASVSKPAVVASTLSLAVMSFVTLYVTGLLQRLIRHKKVMRGIKIAVIVAFVYGVIRTYKVFVATTLIGILLIDSLFTRVEVHKDPAEYGRYIPGFENSEYSCYNSEMFRIFPKAPDSCTGVREFQAAYYDPWDPQYVIYLTSEYDDAGFEEELGRLKSIGIEEYAGIYNVTGEPDGYDIIAMDSDSYYGFVYAMVPENGAGEVTYVGIWFCNYFLDLDVEDYLPQKYLLKGFDASKDNPYRLKNTAAPGLGL